MATLLTAAIAALGCTYGPEQFREIILEPIINSPELRSLVTVTDGIKAKKDVLFAQKMRKVTRIDSGCGTTPTTPEQGIEKVTWDPKPLEAWIAQCGSELETTFLAWGLGVGYKRHDLQEAIIKIQKGYTATPEDANYWNEFVQDTMEEAVRDDIFRIGYFGDPTITAAKLTQGAADVVNYNQLRGLWPQLITLAGTNPKVRAMTISANLSANQAAGLAPGASIEIFNKLVVGADRRLKGGSFGTPVIQATESIIENWTAYRESQNLETSFKLMADGTVQGPKYRGYSIVPVPEWDEILAADFDKGGIIDLPHRAVFTTLANLQMGFDSYDEATQLDSWFNKETKFTHKRANWKQDAKVMRDFLTRVAI